MQHTKLLVDVCSGRWGLSKAFAQRGWKCIGIDLIEPPEIPEGCEFVKADLRELLFHDGVVWMRRGFETWTWRPDFLWASTPCEKFSVHAMRHFHPNPPYPTLGIELFNHVRAGFEATKLPWVMENVRAAQQFVGNAVHHCGPFYLWGNAVPPLIGQGISKSKWTPKPGRKGNWSDDFMSIGSRSSRMATIPPELASCVADYAERLMEQRKYA